MMHAKGYVDLKNDEVLRNSFSNLELYIVRFVNIINTHESERFCIARNNKGFDNVLVCFIVIGKTYSSLLFIKRW